MESTVKEIKYENLTSNTMPSPNVSPVVEGKGLNFWDAEGNKYMDFSSQTLNLLLGQCYPAIVDEVVNQAKKLTFVSSRFGSTAYFDAVNLLIELAPKFMTKANLKMCDGSDANETGIKIAKKYTGKSGIISFNKAHTGQTTQTLLLRGYGRDPKTLHGSKENVYFVNPPECKEKNDYKKTISEIRSLLEVRDDIACILIDPIMANAGVLVNSDTKKYLKEIEKICKEYEILLILDENQSFGWVPELFAATYFDIMPDVITLGKGLSGGHPLAGVIIQEKVEGVIGYNEADFTNGGHPISCAASRATLKTLKEKDFEIIKKEEYISNKIDNLKKISKIKLNSRGIGLIHALEVEEASEEENIKLAANIYQKALQKGIFMRLYNQNIVIKPPIIVSLKEIDELFTVLEDILKEAR